MAYRPAKPFSFLSYINFPANEPLYCWLKLYKQPDSARACFMRGDYPEGWPDR